MATDVDMLLEHLGWESTSSRVSLVGWSMGGMVALRLAARHRNRFHAVVALGVTNGGMEALFYKAWLRD